MKENKNIQDLIGQLVEQFSDKGGVIANFNNLELDPNSAESVQTNLIITYVNFREEGITIQKTKERELVFPIEDKIVVIYFFGCKGEILQEERSVSIPHQTDIIIDPQEQVVYSNNELKSDFLTGARLVYEVEHTVAEPLLQAIVQKDPIKIFDAYNRANFFRG